MNIPLNSFKLSFTVTWFKIKSLWRLICSSWAQVDSNHRPRAYQARALTCWAMSPRRQCRSRTRTYFSLVGEFSRGPLLWACLGFTNVASPSAFWILCVLSFLRFSCLSGQGDRSSVSLAWWRWWDSNPWPPACRAGALPTELHPHVGYPSSSFVLLFTMNNWMNLVHNRLLLENSSSMRDFQVLAGFLSIPASRHASTTHSKLNNNILTPIWFRVGTRISRSP